MDTVWIWAAGIVSILTILGVLLGIAYNMGSFTKELTTNTVVLGKVYEKVTDQDDRIQEVENTKADKKDLEALKIEFTKLQTAHDICHGGKKA